MIGIATLSPARAYAMRRTKFPLSSTHFPVVPYG